MSIKHFIRLLILLIVIALQGCVKLFDDEPATDPVSIFDDVWKTFSEEYAPFEERGVDWNAEYDRFRRLIRADSGPDELYQALTGLLATLDDGHVTLTIPGKEIFVSNRILREKIDDELFSIDLIRGKYLEPGYRSGEEDSFIYGKIKNENIGYIFFEHIGDNFFSLDDFLDAFETSSGIIIDLRHNDGGDFTYSFSEMGRLASQKEYVFKSITKKGPGKDDYTSWKEWYIEPRGKFFNKPVAVLTDRYTISAGERTVMALMALPGTTIIGDTTSGAHGTMVGREAANGWFYSIVPQKVVLFDGRSWEGIGLPPDVFVRNTPAEASAGTDRVLETAIELIR